MPRSFPRCAKCGKSLVGVPHIRSTWEVEERPEVGWCSDCLLDPIAKQFFQGDRRNRRSTLPWPGALPLIEKIHRRGTNRVVLKGKWADFLQTHRDRLKGKKSKGAKDDHNKRKGPPVLSSGPDL